MNIIRTAFFISFFINKTILFVNFIFFNGFHDIFIAYSVKQNRIIDANIVWFIGNFFICLRRII